MAVYYCGYLTKLYFENISIEEYSWQYNLIRENCSQDEYISICQEFNRINDRRCHDFPVEIQNETFIKKLGLFSFKERISEIKDRLIFEKIKDINGQYYAREIYTNKIFPLIDSKDITRKYEFTSLEKVYPSMADVRAFSARIKTRFFLNDSINNILKLNSFFYFPKCEIADQNMIEEYKNKMFKSRRLFHKPKENNRLINKIIRLSNDNVFRNEIIEEKEEKKVIREEQDPITSKMERIEFLLLKLDKINHEIKIIKQKKYDEMLSSLNNNLTISPLNNETLKMFEAELEFAIKFNQKKEDDILDTLDNIINEYNLNNKTDKTIKDIDELVKLFLQMKSNYSLVTQRSVINKFAQIYIYEIYENKNNIKVDDLCDSYINDMLKSVLICLNNMIENKEIENNIIINLEENLSLNYIINCITNINFTKQKVLTLN